MRYSDKTDAELMLSFAKGDMAAFEVLYGRHKDALYRYVVRQVSDKDLAHDLYQEVWSRIIKSSQTYSEQAKWTSWAYRIAHNQVVDHYRTLKPVEPEVEQHASETPESAHEQTVLERQLMGCMGKLPSTQRDVFLLSQETDLSLAVIADIVDASHEAIKSRLRYARQALKDCLARFGIVASSSNRSWSANDSGTDQ